MVTQETPGDMRGSNQGDMRSGDTGDIGHMGDMRTGDPWSEDAEDKGTQGTRGMGPWDTVTGLRLTWCRITGSSARVGSSSTSTWGFLSRARASATPCLCPPESCIPRGPTSGDRGDTMGTPQGQCGDTTGTSHGHTGEPHPLCAHLSGDREGTGCGQRGHQGDTEGTP